MKTIILSKYNSYKENIGGWLMFYTVTSLIGLLFAFFKLIASGELSSLPGSILLISIIVLILGALHLYFIFVRKHRLVIYTLLAQFIFGVFMLTMTKSYILGLSPNISSNLVTLIETRYMRDMLNITITTAVWLAYFLLSVRVKIYFDLTLPDNIRIVDDINVELEVTNLDNIEESKNESKKAELNENQISENKKIENESSQVELNENKISEDKKIETESLED